MNHASYLQPALTTSDLCSRSRGQIQIKEVNTLAFCDDLELNLLSFTSVESNSQLVDDDEIEEVDCTQTGKSQSQKTQNYKELSKEELKRKVCWMSSYDEL